MEIDTVSSPANARDLVNSELRRTRSRQFSKGCYRIADEEAPRLIRFNG
jgi:hypothetical protein